MNKIKVGLVGNPNCGKTTLFNALTGRHQRVGNWPGVTVERNSGVCQWKKQPIEIVDLPGVYSLTTGSLTSSVDERIACEYILNREADVIVNVLDATRLERSLYLTLQLMEMRVPVIVAVNMMDVATQQHIQIKIDELQKILQCPVVCLTASRGKGISVLQQKIVEYKIKQPVYSHINYPDELQKAINTLAADIPLLNSVDPRWVAMRLLEGDLFVRQSISNDVLEKVHYLQQHIQTILHEDADIILADTRYRFIQHMMTMCVHHSLAAQKTWTSWLDQIVLNRFLGIPIFLGVMYFLFVFAINVGGAFQDFFDISSDAIFVEGLAQGLNHMGAPVWLIALLANGVGKGINTTLTFIPVLGAMFLFLAFLEDSGYMARAAFVMDRLMRMLGLPGKAFVPLIIGLGCNVPAVAAARTLENKRDRILTVMMSPFMSCGARLAIYAVFTAAFFPTGGQNVVFGLYMIGVFMAIFTGFLLRKTVLQGDPAPLIMELPAYHLPRMSSVILSAWRRLKHFLFRAGKLIVPICVILGALNSVNVDGTLNTGDGDAHSILSKIGQTLTPIFYPLGIHQDNWPATVGLLTGILAKEVVIGTLNALYVQIGSLANLHLNTFHIGEALQQAWMSIPANLSQLTHAFSHPLLAQVSSSTVSNGVYGEMFKRFDGQIGAMAYLLFVLLYFPCVSTTAAMLRELNRAWTWFSLLWTTGMAYGVAVLFYQVATL